METGEEKLYENTEDMKSPYFGNTEFSYHRPTIRRIKSFNDFNEAEQDNFEEMFHQKSGTLFMQGPFINLRLNQPCWMWNGGLKLRTYRAEKSGEYSLYI